MNTNANVDPHPPRQAGNRRVVRARPHGKEPQGNGGERQTGMAHGRPPTLRLPLEEHPHPNPTRPGRASTSTGSSSTRVRAPIVLMIFDDYCVRLLGLGAICDKLNSNPDLYPPPTPTSKDENGLPHTWSRSASTRCCETPSTRATTCGDATTSAPADPQIRPREEWVWSPTPTHEPIVSRGAIRHGRGARTAQHHAPEGRACHAKRTGDPNPRPGASTRSAGACAAECADAEWRAPTKRAPTGIAASTSTVAEPQPQQPPATPRSTGSRRTRSSARSSTF